MTGMVLNNRYRLDAELGQGGMGVVYQGYDLLLGREVAVKLLNKAGLGTEGRSRLLREAQAVAKLNHPNIVTLYDAGEAEGAPFIVMELLSGLSLYERKPDGIDELIEVARQVCAALAHAHEHGIIHRDLKPENVILTGRRSAGNGGDLRVKLTDFGLARSNASRQTVEGGLVGTVYYMPPEQAMGRELDGRADLYSLGVMLYELSAGRLPFAGDDPLTVIAQHLHAPAVPPSTYNPAIGQTDAWFWTLSLAGLVTMLLGAYQGFRQNDLKGLLAYSTISQLGAMVMLIGQDTEIAFKALVIAVLAHALYKSALFLVTGSVDHEAHTRELRRLGGLRRSMPVTAAVAVVAGLSMAGLPPLLGFLAKETLLATVTHPAVPATLDLLFPAAAVAAGALLLAQAGLFVWDTLFGRPRDPSVQAHEAPWPMIAAPAIPALLSLLVGIGPEPAFLAGFLAAAAGAAHGAPVKVSLAFWTGINPPLILSAVAISVGALLFYFRTPLRARLAASALSGRFSLNQVYDGVIAGLDGAGALATRTQSGQLRRYLFVIIAGVLALVLLFGGVPLPAQLAPLDLTDELALLRLFTLLLAAGAALLSVLLRRDFAAILALGASGLAVAVIIALEPAPDVALVQVVVDLLSVVILTLTLSNLPRAERERASEFTFAQSRPGLIGDAIIATGAGLLVASLTLVALASRPRPSVVTPFYEANAKPAVGAADIVGAIVIDFRGFDTLVEIAVFAMAGLAVYTLLRYAAHKPWLPAHIMRPDELAGDARRDVPRVLGITGGRTSPLVRVLGYALLPLSLVLAAVQMMYGHNQGGDGFTAAVIVGLAVAFWYVVFGYAETQRQLWWLRPARMIVGGLLIALANGTLAAILAGGFFGQFDYGKAAGLVLPAGFHLSTSFVFEVAIFAAVLGGVSFILEAIGHPKDRPVEMEQ